MQPNYTHEQLFTLYENVYIMCLEEGYVLYIRECKGQNLRIIRAEV